MSWIQGLWYDENWTIRMKIRYVTDVTGFLSIQMIQQNCIYHIYLCVIMFLYVFVAIDGIFTNKFSIQKWPKSPSCWPHESGSGFFLCVYSLIGMPSERPPWKGKKKGHRPKLNGRYKATTSAADVHHRALPKDIQITERCERAEEKGRPRCHAMSECQFLEVSCRSPVGFCILPRCLVLSGVVAISSQL